MAAAMFIAGFVLVNANSFTMVDLARSMARTGTATYEFSRLFSLLVYGIQLPV